MTEERFAQGMTLEQYVEQMTVNKNRFIAALEHVTVEPGDTRMLERLGSARKVLVMTEDWCGTSLAYVPRVAKAVEARPDIEMRIFLRDANPDVMGQYLKRGRLPIDPRDRVLRRAHERARAVHRGTPDVGARPTV